MEYRLRWDFGGGILTRPKARSGVAREIYVPAQISSVHNLRAEGISERRKYPLDIDDTLRRFDKPLWRLCDERGGFGGHCVSEPR